MSSNLCGQITPCAVFFSSNRYNSPLNVLYSWTFTLLIGYNRLFLDQPITIFKGNLILLTQTVARLGIDSSGSTYSDLILSSNVWSSLDFTSNWRFYLNLVSMSSQGYYQSQLNIIHEYSSLGLYNFSLSIGNNTIYQELANITDCKLRILINIK